MAPTFLAMGYELVDIEFAGGGLLRVTIDIADRSRAVQVEDCERVTHQIGPMLAVENIDYHRLEVSSPGLDRPLKRAADFERFAGEKVSIRLRQPVDGRRQFTGILQRGESAATDAPGGWVLLVQDEPGAAGAVRRGRRSPSFGLAGRLNRKAPASSRARAGAPKQPGAEQPGQAHQAGDDGPRRLEFTLDQVDKARLVPNLGF